MTEPTERDRELAIKIRAEWLGNVEWVNLGDTQMFPRLEEMLAAGIAVGRAEERERCAKIASERDVRHDGHYDAPLSVYDRGYLKACQEIAAKIRSGE